jgi:hypothetical protein
MTEVMHVGVKGPGRSSERLSLLGLVTQMFAQNAVR